MRTAIFDNRFTGHSIYRQLVSLSLDQRHADVPKTSWLSDRDIEDLWSGDLKVESVERPFIHAPRLERTLFANPVHAGFPSPADDYVEGVLDLNEHFIPHPSSTFFIRVVGLSMEGAGILPGDILIVDKSLKPADGSIVIAVVDDELTVKRLHRVGRSFELHAENPSYAPICFTGDMELRIWGVVAGVTRKC